MKISNLGALVLTTSLVAAQQAHAFGPDGHRIAGLVAEAYLCAEASVEIGRLGQGGAILPSSGYGQTGFARFRHGKTQGHGTI